MRIRDGRRWSFTTRHAFHVLGLDRRGVLRRLRVGTHRIVIERGGITLHITSKGAP